MLNDFGVCAALMKGPLQIVMCCIQTRYFHFPLTKRKKKENKKKYSKAFAIMLNFFTFVAGIEEFCDRLNVNIEPTHAANNQNKHDFDFSPLIAGFVYILTGDPMTVVFCYLNRPYFAHKFYEDMLNRN